jgi:hypothetical protein
MGEWMGRGFLFGVGIVLAMLGGTRVRGAKRSEVVGASHY